MEIQTFSNWDPFIVFSTVILLLILFYWYGMLGFSVLNRLNVPGPKPLPFVGNILEVRKYGSIHLMIFDYVKKYGKIFAISLGRKPSLVVADPDMLKTIMVKEFATFHNRMMPTPPPPMGSNVFSARDETWKRIRNILTPSFSARKMKLMVSLIEESCDVLLKKLESIADTGEYMWRGLVWSDVASQQMKDYACSIGSSRGVQPCLFWVGFHPVVRVISSY